MSIAKIGQVAALGFIAAAIGAPPVSLAQVQPQLAQASKPAKPTRAQLDAQEREVTRQLNEAQLKK
jgi:hypothetical protein